MFLTGRSDAIRPSSRVLAQGTVIGETALPPGNDAISHRFVYFISSLDKIGGGFPLSASLRTLAQHPLSAKLIHRQVRIHFPRPGVDSAFEIPHLLEPGADEQFQRARRT